MRVDKLQEGLRTKLLGRKLFFLHSVSSANDFSKELASHGAEEGTVVVAKIQSAGRGRLKRRWLSPKGGLWFSVVLRPRLSPSEASKLVFAAGLAVAKALDEAYGLAVEVKWPNDVLVKGKKICGILTEMSTARGSVRFVVVGVGVNANFDVRRAFPEELRLTATSLENELGRKVRLEELLRVILEKLEDAYELFLKKGFGPVLKEWKTYADFLEHKVEVSGAAERLVGLATDVDSDGSLVLRLADGTLRHVVAGDVSLRL
jgi:BirA family biotin operon repressor/biotin-[acetyl-CoA-carboxylase] ligase